MGKIYLQENVYDAAMERIDYIFQEFDNIYVGFSGGKDSGLLLNLVMDRAKKTGYTEAWIPEQEGASINAAEIH